MTDNKPTLAQRRAALVAQCAAQRAEASQEMSNMFTPVLRGGGGIMHALGRSNLKVPLTIAGVVLGMIAVRPARFIPLITTGISLWKMAEPVLEMLRRPSVEKY